MGGGGIGRRHDIVDWLRSLTLSRPCETMVCL